MKVRVDGEVLHTAAEGDGPVDALDAALRKALAAALPARSPSMHLADYKVRILDGTHGTAAVDARARRHAAAASAAGARSARAPTSSRRAGARSWTPWSTGSRSPTRRRREGANIDEGADRRPARRRHRARGDRARRCRVLEAVAREGRPRVRVRRAPHGRLLHRPPRHGAHRRGARALPGARRGAARRGRRAEVGRPAGEGPARSRGSSRCARGSASSRTSARCGSTRRSSTRRRSSPSGSPASTSSSSASSPAASTSASRRGATAKDGHERAVDTLEYHDYEIRRVVELAFRLARGAAQEGHLGRQGERARVVAAVAADRDRRSARRTPTSRSTTCSSTPPRCGSSPSPASLDVVVTENMFGDILTDEASVLAGLAGHAARRASLGDGGPGPVRADPRLGARHRRARASRTRSARSSRAAMLLRHSLGLDGRGGGDRAARSHAAVAEGARTRDLGGIALDARDGGRGAGEPARGRARGDRRAVAPRPLARPAVGRRGRVTVRKLNAGRPRRDHPRAGASPHRPPRSSMIRRLARCRSPSRSPRSALAACARNPVTGKRELALVSEEQEIALGKQSRRADQGADGRVPGREGPGVRAATSACGWRRRRSGPNCPGSSPCSTIRR